MSASDPDHRYSRQIAMPQIGSAGQKRLAGSSVLVAGAGGLGSAILYNLAGAGIGRIGICDNDLVQASNLNRQYLYTPQDIGKEKLDLAIKRLRAFQPETSWQTLPGRLDLHSAQSWINHYDLVISAVDNVQTRLDLNQAACICRRPLIDAGVQGFSGYLLFVHPGRTACYTCYSGLTEAQEKQPDASKAVIAATAGVIGSLQASLAIGFLLGLSDPLESTLLLYDGQAMRFNRIRLQRSRQCPVCAAI